MTDLGANYTDAELKKFEKKINTVYKQAEVDIKKKMKDFNAKYKAKEAKHLKDLANGKITQEQFDSWKAGQVFQGKQWQAKKDQIANTLLHANEIATSIMNGQMTNVFAANANFMSYSLETGAGVNFGFGIYDSATVSNLLKNDPQLLPNKKVNKAKDNAWNRKKIARQTTLGIIEGEDLDTIANRLGSALGIQNKNAMLTQARTAMTSAQNAGRDASLNAAKEMGINVNKKWMCTLDNRTRDQHRRLDGQTKPTDKPFEIDNLKIRFPGDPQAHPSLVWNCRCTMIGDLVDYPSTYDRYDNIEGKPIKGMTYKEWEAAKSKGEDISPVPLTWKKFVEENKQTINIKDLFNVDDFFDLDFELVEKINEMHFNEEWFSKLDGNPFAGDVWKMYQKGTLPKEFSDKMDDLLIKYAKDKGLLKDTVATPTFKGLFENKKMSNVYNDMKNVDKSVANEFYKELKQMGKPSDIWNKYMDGTLSDNEAKKLEGILEKYLKKSDKSKTIVDDVAAKTAKKVKSTGDPLKDAQKELKEAEEALQNAKISNKIFSGIWEEDVTYADYASKKEVIAKKKKYYEEQIKKYSDNIKSGSKSQSWNKWAQKKIDKFEGYLKDLEDFEENGKAYYEYFKAVEDAKIKIKKASMPVNVGGKQFADDAFDDATKKAAKNFTNKRAADQFHRKHLDSIWDDLTDEEKYGVWEYTRNSNPMNKSLSGYHDDWDRSSFIGPLNTDWGHEDSWRSIPSAFKKFGKGGNVTYHKAITDTTKAIEKSALPDGVMLVRGSDKGGFAGMIEGDLFSFDQAKKLLNSGDPDKIKKALEGQVIQNHAFTSTGIASGTGFSGEVSYKIYAPKGTKGIYAEPQSYYGETVGSRPKLYEKGQSYSSVGQEAEVILQRGTKFRITKIEGDSYRMTVHMEVVEQPDYFKFGDEDTFNDGLTRHKR